MKSSFTFSQPLVNYPNVFFSINKTNEGKPRQQNQKGFLNYLFLVLQQGYMGCPHERSLSDHSIYHELSNRHIQGVNSPDIIKPVPHSLYTKNIRCFIWGIPLGIYRGSWAIPLLRVNRAYSSFYPVHQGGCSLGNSVLCIWITYSHLWLFHNNLWVLYQPKHALPLCSIKN